MGNALLSTCGCLTEYQTPHLKILKFASTHHSSDFSLGQADEEQLGLLLRYRQPFEKQIGKLACFNTIQQESAKETEEPERTISYLTYQTMSTHFSSIKIKKASGTGSNNQEQRNNNHEREAPVIQPQVSACRAQKVQFEKYNRLVIKICKIQKHQDEREALIIFPEGYFKGNVNKQNLPEGEGAYYYLTSDYEKKMLTVEGEWINGEPRKLDIYDHNNTQQLQPLSLREICGERYARVTIPGIGTYEGQIKLRSSTCTPQILSGMGQIHFSEGDFYKGRLLCGDMHTNLEQNEKATFTGKSATYIGQYQYGFRHGSGILNFQSGGEKFTFESKWEYNLPINQQLNIIRDSDGRSYKVRNPQLRNTNSQ